ncbi:hypothetical protein K435DRAFT_798386 [Dendrothele bispora CBS 962.96]|uniref:Uncharacterized protein n=1 Tax=Dendrothele bispora (strain CBS 962.96) TaxID=1314807 RepID=A0A4S8LZB2_DENBC|nr:hypothetical protein K435DRAFT_798386 [Dendrothele bispora CBS 962.96]
MSNSPSDNQLSELQLAILPNAIGSLAFGIYFPLALSAIYNLSETNRMQGYPWSKPRLALLLFTSAMLLLAIMNLHYPTLSSIQAIQLFASRFTYILSDGIVIWRAWVFYPEKWTARSILILSILGACGANLVDLTADFKEVLIGTHPGNEFAETLTFPMFSLVANFVATLMIGYKAWCHRGIIQLCLSLSNKSAYRAQKILVLLVESGVIYCVFWVLLLVLGAVMPNVASLPIQIIMDALPVLSAIYPVLIVLILARERFVEQQYSQNMSLSQSIRFALGPGNNDELKESV